MKGAAVIAAAGLLGSAQAGGVHSLKLKKIPLAKQLVGSLSCIDCLLSTPLTSTGVCAD